MSLRHGCPADRGAADRYYRRPCDPHWWPEGSYKGQRVEKHQMTAQQVKEYTDAWLQEEDRKDWG